MHVKILQMSQSDVGLPDVQYEKEVGNGLHEKQYDFAYDMSLGGGKNVKNKSASVAASARGFAGGDEGSHRTL